MTSLLGSSKQPRYANVADALMRDIASGVYPVGTLLPPEAVLCERFQVSRATVREALRMLSESGIVNKAQGIGTRVESSEVQSKYVLTIDSTTDLMQYGTETTLYIFERTTVVTEPDTAKLLDSEPGERWIRLRGLRSLRGNEGRPIAYSEIFIDARFADVANEISPTVAYHKLIAERHAEPISSIDQDISAVDIPEDVAMRLGTEPNSAGLQIIRRFYGSARRPLEVTINLHPKNRFHYQLRLNRAATKST